MTELEPGKSAPSFVKRALDGGEVKLSNYKGSKVWLAFYRYAGCPLCNLYLSQIATKLPQLAQAGLKMIAIFESKPELFPQEVVKNPAPRRLIADPEKDLYLLYEVETRLGAALHPAVIFKWLEATGKGFKQPMPDGALGTVPAHFLIDEVGVLQRVKYGNHIGDHISIDEVEEFVFPKKSWRLD